MASKITIRDKALIRARVARGWSFAKAREGTHVCSTSTVKRIVDEKPNNIEELKEEFLALVYKEGGDVIRQAKVAAKGLSSTRLFGKNAIKHPDFKTRLEYLKYIKELEGIGISKEGVTVNILNNQSFLKQYDER